MKVLMIFDQIQAGMGGKENPNLPLGGKNGSIGAATTLEPHLKKFNGEIVACLYCGDGYFTSNQDEVALKMTAMVKKIAPDVVICGPAYNYKGYASMCARLAYEISSKLKMPCVAAMSEENTDTLAQYKNLIHIVKMPKKGGIGLNDSLEHIAALASKTFKNEASEEYIKQICY